MISQRPASTLEPAGRVDCVPLVTDALAGDPRGERFVYNCTFKRNSIIVTAPLVDLVGAELRRRGAW